MMVDKLNDVLNHVETYTTMYVFCSYTKSHIHDIADMTIEEVAKACHTSKGQISKCAKNLGFTSYLEFKDACIDYIHSFQDLSLIHISEPTRQAESRMPSSA